MRRLRLLGPVLLGGVVVLAGCGSGDDAAQPGSAADDRPVATVARGVGDETGLPSACALLPEADVEAAFGEAVAGGPRSIDECWWSTPNDLKVVNLIRRSDDLATWRSGYDNDFWAPNDFGDEGYTGRALDSIVWRIGDAQYEVNVVYSTKGDPASVVRTLAGKALARL